ncbi:MAG: 23S rRNA (adenine(2503)-C(2))-methyltransferase RlmN [Clostridia bacterium]|nr:23S rRNA (adenine(2503)-C(2))-methyltransferase RlmN [Clostridia bacterium]
MKVLQDLNLEELQALMSEWGEQKFRAKQLLDNINLGKSISSFSNISKELKDKLLAVFADIPLEIHTEQVSKDGTRKFAYKLADGNIIEGVLMSYKYGNTLCVSTQVGCRMGCKFCASTLGGLARNLTAGEILAQVLVVNALLGGKTGKNRQITNIVLMGSGEPMDNYENVVKFLRLVSSENGLNVSPRNISLSTCGIVPNIYKLADEGLQVILTLSLHAPNDELRRTIMPIANKYSVKEVVEAAKFYFEKTGRRVVFEYALMEGVNNTPECAKELAGLVHGFPTHINLIPLNEVKERDLKTVTHKKAEQFADMLKRLGASVTIRRTIADDIDGACGQLRNKIVDSAGE